MYVRMHVYTEEEESRRIPTRVLVCTALLFLGPAIQVRFHE